MLDSSNRSIFQLGKTMAKYDNGTANAYKFNKKTHATMKKKKIIPLYLEHIRFLVKRPGRTVIQIHLHYTFKQECFKIKFIIMNQFLDKKPKVWWKKISIYL